MGDRADRLVRRWGMLVLVLVVIAAGAWALYLGTRSIIGGTVVGPDGIPMAGVRMCVLPRVYKDTVSDRQGQFRMRRNSTGMHWQVPYVVARSEDRNLAVIEMIEVLGGDQTLLRLVLAPAATFTGRVATPDDKPLPNASVRVLFWSDRAGWPLPHGDVRTDTEGRFTVAAIPVNAGFEVWITRAGYGKQIVRLEPNEVVAKPIDFGRLTLMPADTTISGIVVDRQGNPVPGARVMPWGDQQPNMSEIRTDRQGRFQVRGVCRAPIRIQVYTPGRRPDMRGSVEAVGGATDVRITMFPTGEQGERRADQKSPRLGQPLPALPALDAQAAAADFRGQPLLVCLFDYEQRPSRQCLRELVKQAETLAGKDVRIVAIQTTPVERSALDAWVKEQGIPFPVASLSQDVDKAASPWRTESLPWLILTDHRHVVTAEGFGLSELSKKLDESGKEGR